MKIGIKLILGFLSLVLLVEFTGYFLTNIMQKAALPLVSSLPVKVEELTQITHLNKYTQSIFYHRGAAKLALEKYIDTQDQEWKERYNEVNEETKELIEEAIGAATEENKELFGYFDKLHHSLEKTELRSMGLADRKDREGAMEVLQGALYRDQANQFTSTLLSYESEREASVKEISEKIYASMTVSILSVRLLIQEGMRVLLGGGLAFFVLSLVMSLLLANSITTPLIKLKNATEEIGNGNFDTPMDFTSDDEIGDLASSLKKMAADLKASTTSIDRLNQEVDERKKAETWSLEQKKILEEILDSLAHPFYVIDSSDYTIKMANRVANFGTLTDSSYCYALTHKRDKPCAGDHICPMMQVKNSKKPVVVEHIHADSDGKEINVEVHGYPIFDEHGNVVQMIEYTLNITDRKKAERQAMQLQKQLLHSQKLESVGTMANGIAHSFNNLFAIIRGYTEMALSEIPPDSQPYLDLQNVLRGTENAKALAAKMLDFSRNNEPSLTRTDMSLVVRNSLKLFKASMASHIEIRENIEASASYVMADTNQIEQVLLNLCNNSYQAMRSPEGFLEVNLEEIVVGKKRASKHSALREGEYVKLCVKDSGDGMDQETMERIFEPFFTTKEVGVGTGLGLSVVHGIIKNHDGEIVVESVPGKGSEFTIYLPKV